MSNGRGTSDQQFPNISKNSHPIPIGTVVTVIRLIEGRAPFIESRNTVVTAYAPGHHRYLVKVPGEPRMHERFVCSAYQSDPDGTLAWLLDLWRSSREPPSHEEFFPDDPQTKGE
jgi:hypothetical protein